MSINVNDTIINKLEELRKPFAKEDISKLPKPTKRQTELVRDNISNGARCPECGGWHHPDVIHLDYVGHAALTKRLLDVDPFWNWEPLAKDDVGNPAYDKAGGMWIKLTVAGVTRHGYGHAGDKKGGDAIKEIIGDALRNAGMRFGMALELWHKGEFHKEDEQKEDDKRESTGIENEPITDSHVEKIEKLLSDIKSTKEAFCDHYKIDSLESITIEQYPKVIKILEDKKEAMK